MNFIKTIVKRIFSYAKTTWDFENYPIRTWINPNAGEPKVAYGAGIINWSTMVGHGETREKAIEALKEHFRLYSESNDYLPRPGTKVPLKFAPSEEIDKYEDIAVDFFQKVLGMDYYDGFYSDGSCLQYFEPPDNEEKAKNVRDSITRKTLEYFNVDISQTYDEPLYKVLKRIADNR